MSLTINIYDNAEVTAKSYKGFDEEERVIVEIGTDTLTLPLKLAIKLHEALEKTVVASEYWYDNMQAENDRLQQRIEDLEEVLNNLQYEEAV